MLRKSRWFHVCRSRSPGLRIYRKSAFAAISAIERPGQDASFEGKFPFEQVETSSENSRLPGIPDNVWHRGYQCPSRWQCTPFIGDVPSVAPKYGRVEFEVRSRENQSTWSLLGPNWNYRNFWSTSDNSQYVVSLWRKLWIQSRSVIIYSINPWRYNWIRVNYIQHVDSDTLIISNVHFKLND